MSNDIYGCREANPERGSAGYNFQPLLIICEGLESLKPHLFASRILDASKIPLIWPLAMRQMLSSWHCLYRWARLWRHEAVVAARLRVLIVGHHLMGTCRQQGGRMAGLRFQSLISLMRVSCLILDCSSRSKLWNLVVLILPSLQPF